MGIHAPTRNHDEYQRNVACAVSDTLAIAEGTVGTDRTHQECDQEGWDGARAGVLLPARTSRPSAPAEGVGDVHVGVEYLAAGPERVGDDPHQHGQVVRVVHLCARVSVHNA